MLFLFRETNIKELKCFSPIQPRPEFDLHRAPPPAPNTTSCSLSPLVAHSLRSLHHGDITLVPVPMTSALVPSNFKVRSSSTRLHISKRDTHKFGRRSSKSVQFFGLFFCPSVPPSPDCYFFSPCAAPFANTIMFNTYSCGHLFPVCTQYLHCTISAEHVHSYL